MLETSILLLFLVPGLAAYAALYGLFHDGRTIAPEPPGANTVEAVAVIAGVSIIVHALSATGFALNDWLCETRCPLTVPVSWNDPYRSAVRAVAGNGIGGLGIGVALMGVTAQGYAVYRLVRWWLARQARRDRLPSWIYGWATLLANVLDNSGSPILAYVLTTRDIDGRALAYGGLVYDVSLRQDGCINRITLYDCERYLVDLSSDGEAPSLSDALSQFSFMVIGSDQIRNVAFERILLDPVADD